MKHPVLKFLIILIVLLIFMTGVFYIFSNQYETSLQKAAECMRAGDYARAAGLYDKAHQNKPKEIEPVLGLAKAYYMKDEWDEALKFYYEAQRMNPQSIEIMLSLANIHKAKDETGEAEYLYLQALELDDTVFEAYLNLAEIYLQRSDTHKLSAIVEKAKKSAKGGNIDSLLEMAGSTGEQGEESNKTVKTASGSAPQVNSTPAGSAPSADNGVLTDKSTADGETPKNTDLTPVPEKEKSTAIPTPVVTKAAPTPEVKEKITLEEPIKPVPAKPEANPSSGYYTEQKIVALSSNMEGTVIYYTTDGKQPDQYAQKYSQPILLPEGFTQIKAIAVSSDGVVSETGVFEYHIDRLTEIMNAAIYYFDNNQPDLSISKFHEALEINPDLIDAVFRLAELYYDKNDEKNAEIFYQKAIELDPAYQEGYVELALIHINRDEVPEAVKILKEGKNHVQGAELISMLDALLTKPAMPKADAASGYYNEEMDIALVSQTPGVSIYYTTNGKTPDISSTLYTGPIRLTEGITTVKAVSVSKALVQSDISEYKYEIEIPIPINFTDKALESRVRELLQKFNEPVTHIDTRQIRQLVIIGDQAVPPDKIVMDEKGRPKGYYDKNSKYAPWNECETTGEIRTLEDLKWFTGLELLDVRFNQLTDEYALRDGIKYPVAVTFQDKELEEYVRELLQKPGGFILSWDLQAIEKIRIVGNTLVTEDRIHYTAEGMFSYYGVDGKEYSWHECARRGGITTLADMIWFTRLKDLYIRFNNLNSLNGIEYLKELKYLDLSYNFIKDIDALEKLPFAIQSVDLNENRIKDISVFQRMDPYAVKVFVGLSNNNITDITPLENIVLEFIYLGSNPIQNGQSTIKKLEDRGIEVFQ